MSEQIYTIEPIKLVDEVSTTLFYIGVSLNGGDTSKPSWRIKKISKEGSVWKTTQFPDGKQSYSFVWDDRGTYNYK